MRDTVRTQLKSLRKAENIRKKAKERTKKILLFTANPYKFARNLLVKRTVRNTRNPNGRG